MKGVRVKGVLKLGDKPLAGEILFGGYATNSTRCPANAKGEFHCTLPFPGPWPVLIKAGAVQRQLTVEVSVPKGKKEAWVELSLPATRLRGKVVLRDGRVPPKVGLFLEAPGQPPTTVVLEGPEDFVVEGLPPGLWSVRAARAGWASRPALVSLAEDQEPPPVVLVLEPLRELKGKVLNPAGLPVAGAQVAAFALPQVTSRPLAGADSDPQGQFSLELPEGVASRALAVKAPGYARQVMAVQGEVGEVVVALDTSGGSLILTLPLKAREEAVVVSQNLLAESLWELEERAKAHGEAAQEKGETVTLRVPARAPGTYGLCRGAEWAGERVHGSRCRWGQLSAGGELGLSLAP